jgi:hypothetical protein
MYDIRLQVGARSTAIATSLADLYPSLHFVVQMCETEPPRALTPLRSPLATPQFSRGSTPSLIPSELRQSLSSRIIVQQRALGTPQNVHDAAVYILHLPSASPRLPSQSVLAQTTAELRAHIGVLRANSSATLVLTARLLPEPGAIDPDIEAIARLQDLSLVQLTNEQEIQAPEVMDMLNSVRDRTGRLVLVSKLCSRNNATIAFEIRYQTYADRHDI